MFELSDFIDLLIAPFRHFTDPGDRLSVIYMFTALVVAIGVYIHTKVSKGELKAAGLVKWLLPMEILRHPSAQVDFAFFYVNRVLQAAVYSSILVLTPMAMGLTTEGMVWAFGEAGPGIEPRFWLTLLLTLVLLAITDAALWYLHYLFHVIPVLWEFHKVHHSAEVMTPITAARMHPVEELLDSLVASVIVGGAFAFFKYFLGPAATQFTIFEINILMGVFFLAAFNLRHSHVWVRYPTWLQHIFICPAQHQIHHSTAQRHWDKNMGFIFACWDWAGGTLYAPTEKEEITYGLGNHEDGTWHSLTALYFRPFRQAWGRLWPAPAAPVPNDEQTEERPAKSLK